MSAPMTTPTTANGTGAYQTHLQVELGQHTYPVYAQKHAYLTRRLDKAMLAMGDLADLDTSRGTLTSFVEGLGDKAYDLLKVFIPKLMPKHEFMGFPTQDAYERDKAGDEDAYDPEMDESPSIPQIVDAVQAGLKVNRLDMAKHLGKVVDIDLIKAWVTKQLADLMQKRMSETSLTSSATTTPPTTSTPSLTTPPTSTENEDSPSPDSIS